MTVKSNQSPTWLSLSRQLTLYRVVLENPDLVKIWYQWFELRTVNVILLSHLYAWKRVEFRRGVIYVGQKRGPKQWYHGGQCDSGSNPEDTSILQVNVNQCFLRFIRLLYNISFITTKESRRHLCASIATDSDRFLQLTIAKHWQYLHLHIRDHHFK